MTEIVDECQLKYIRHSALEEFTFREAVTDKPSSKKKDSRTVESIVILILALVLRIR